MAPVGREEELELLLRRWSKAKTGEGQVVLLSGEAGIGKSRLTAALLDRIANEPHTLAQLTRINAPTQITFGRHDMVTSTRFADAMKNGIKRSELLVFESCSHAPIYESVSEFNQKTLSFLSRHTG